MNQERMYPLRFEPIYQYRLWGGRRLADLLMQPITAPSCLGRVEFESEVVPADEPVEGALRLFIVVEAFRLKVESVMEESRGVVASARTECGSSPIHRAVPRGRRHERYRRCNSLRQNSEY